MRPFQSFDSSICLLAAPFALATSFLRMDWSRSFRFCYRRASPSYALMFHDKIKFMRGPSMKIWTTKPRSMQKTKLKASR